MGNLEWVAHLFATQVLYNPTIKLDLISLFPKIKFKEKQNMSTNKDLFKEAIADAKAVREAALANAKVALEEALAPKLQSMLAAKLQEMELDETKDADEDDKMEEGFYPETTGDLGQDAERAKGFALEEGDEEELEEDFDLSEVLAELSENADEDADDTMKEAEGEDEEETEDAEDEMDSEDEMESEGDKITDLTVDELKDIIKDIISAELEAEEYETPEDEAGEEGGEEMNVDLGGEEGEEENIDMNVDEELDEIDLEELLAELDALHEGKEAEEEELDEISGEGIAALVGLIPGVVLTAAIIKDIVEYMKDNNLKGIDGFKQAYKAVGGAASAYMDKTVGGNTPGQGYGVDPSKTFGPQNETEDLEEAIDTINTLRNELNEVNLLNAKLLFVNKIFKAKNLTESQKLKVIASFDKAATVTEAKSIFESMSGAIEKSKKSTIKESLGFASKAAGVAPQKQIVEVNETVSRWQMLAGIK